MAPSDPHRDFAGVLHDVSNALTVLLGWVGEARAPGATPESTAYALTIIEQHARIARDLARHAIGSSRIDEQRELGAIVEDVGKALVVLAQHGRVQLVVTGGDSRVRVAGALDLAQVLTNLLLNALAYAPLGTSVEIFVVADEERCTLLVSDNGPGVAPEHRDDIFQGHSQRPGGTGVGLRHSRALARAWHGDVELVMHEGQGARFRVTWPRIDAIPRPPTSTSYLTDLAGMRVLLIEDDLAVTQLLETALGARGAQVTTAGTPAEVASSLERGTYDAALIDLSPIAGDATGAIARLRAGHPHVQIILVTGNADALPVTLTDETVELVRKPFEVQEVIAALARRPRRG